MSVHLAHQLGMLDRFERDLADGFRQVADTHGDEPDVAQTCSRLARQCDAHVDRLGPFVDRYGEDAPAEPDRLHHDLFQGTRTGGFGLLRDLHDLYLLASGCDISWTLIGQAAQGARDAELLAVVQSCDAETTIHLCWLTTRMKQAAPQALLVAS
ncbi:MAG TPA: hypothetical protein VGO60_15165 [Iamia sp.]|jgi:hypothetical protein|nr:hypothetical protein [Iamia sp.]